jgi:ABC-type multidrug transport system ATPase subunit
MQRTCLYIDAAMSNTMANSRHIHAHGLDGELRVLHVPSVNLYVMRYTGQGEVLLNGQRMGERQPLCAEQWYQRSPARRGTDLLQRHPLRLHEQGRRSRIVFKADAIEYAFPNGRLGLHELKLAETGGKLIGIMGGQRKWEEHTAEHPQWQPEAESWPCDHQWGRCTHRTRPHPWCDRAREPGRSADRGTYRLQNLFYNAKLCFGDQNDAQVGERVLRMLQTLGLYETKDLKVGSPLEKTISGGQRKRLNIALELIREPSVLFVDEPTSGLSSRDSENIMDLLKELALKGRLVFVVIHQPSSDIFKLFDRLLLMDQEGHPVYYGDPVDAVVYFKRVTGQVNSDVGQCNACGNVNPEQIFNILEAKLVDEYGNETDQRRISPEAWNEVFRAQMDGRVAQVPEERSIPKSTFAVPDRIRQLKVYFKRDLLSKLANRQYVLINLVEAPALAFLMAFFLKFYRTGHGTVGQYVFRQNDNIPQYLFIAVIVALFLGLTVSAEEIIRDRKILQREKFLDLSWLSYLLSKIGILFLISALQTFLFVAVGHAVLGIQGMHAQHWLLLFSTSCFANVLGLNVSASFNSAKVIYIMIPVLIIPQLLFSGIIVKFDKLHPWFASERSVPLLGNVMASRWAYEGLAVTQFMGNAYESGFYALDQRMKSANWKKDLWVRELENSIGSVRRALKGHTENVDVAYEVGVIRTELQKASEQINGYRFERIEELTAGAVSAEVLDDVEASLQVLTQHYRSVYKAAEAEKEQRIAAMTATPELRTTYFELLDSYRNESLADVVTNKNDVNVIVADRGELIQKSDPIYLEPVHSGFFGAQFYAPTKWIAGLRVPTLFANVLVLWGMALLLVATLYGELFPRLLKLIPSRKLQ